MMIKSEAGILSAVAKSPFHMQALHAVRQLDLPECWIAAGFVRNYVWDLMHGLPMTPLNDIDVIYFDAANQNEAFEKQQEERLNDLMPGHPWSVKNQARMHIKNGDNPYDSNETALKHWCETVTPIGVKLEPDDALSLIAPLGIDDLLNLECHATPFAKSKPAKLTDYRTRMQEKKWWELWPQVTVHDLEPATGNQ